MSQQNSTERTNPSSSRFQNMNLFSEAEAARSATPAFQQQRELSQHQRLTFKYPPFFITLISLFQLIVFIYYAFRSDLPISIVGPVPFKSSLIYNPYRRYEFWRYLTYALIHAGYWHIFFNILIQLAVGIPLEIVHRFNPVALIYIGGVVGGSLGNSIADPHSYLAGASGGLYALFAAHLSSSLVNWRETKGACVKLVTLLLFVSADISVAMYERYSNLRSIAYRTSYGAHLTGAFSGFLLGLVFLRNVKKHYLESNVSRWAGGTYLVLFVSI